MLPSSTSFLIHICIVKAKSCDTELPKPAKDGYKKAVMKKYIIEREIPGAGTFTAEKLKEISGISCGVLIKQGPQIQWVQSYVAGDKIYCIYNAPDEEMIREHARLRGFPANLVTVVSSIIDPVTAG
jgi:hypothetical protein